MFLQNTLIVSLLASSVAGEYRNEIKVRMMVIRSLPLRTIVDVWNDPDTLTHTIKRSLSLTPLIFYV